MSRGSLDVYIHTTRRNEEMAELIIGLYVDDGLAVSISNIRRIYCRTTV